jgi:hypothetical protein
MSSHDPSPEQRESCLPMALAGILIAFSAVAMLVITFGWVLYLLAAVLALAALVGFHYFLWGRALTQEVEDAKLQRLADSAAQEEEPPPQWPPDQPPRDSYRPRF